MLADSYDRAAGGTLERIWICVNVDECLANANPEYMLVFVYVWRRFSAVSAALTHKEWRMWCFAGKEGGLSVSLSISCASLVSLSASLPTCPPYPYPLPPLPLGLLLPFFPQSSLPSPSSQWLVLKGRKNAKPAQISVIISFTGAELMSRRGPGFTSTKDKVKRKSERKKQKRGRFWAIVRERLYEWKCEKEREITLFANTIVMLNFRYNWELRIMWQEGQMYLT